MPEPEHVMPTAWLLIWTIYCVKLAMILAIFWAIGTLDPMAMVAITTWFWLGPALALAASPAAFKVRLLRMRRRRAVLIASEWSVEPADRGSDQGSSSAIIVSTALHGWDVEPRAR